MFFVRFSILVIILSVSLNVFSQSIEDIKKQKEKAEKEIVYLNKLLKDADKNKAVSTEKVNILQEKIVQSERVLHSLSQELAYLKKDISDNESRIAELERRKDSRSRNLSSRSRKKPFRKSLKKGTIRSDRRYFTV